METLNLFLLHIEKHTHYITLLYEQYGLMQRHATSVCVCVSLCMRMCLINLCIFIYVTHTHRDTKKNLDSLDAYNLNLRKE